MAIWYMSYIHALIITLLATNRKDNFASAKVRNLSSLVVQTFDIICLYHEILWTAFI